MKGLENCRPCYKPALTPESIEQRLIFAEEYINRSTQFWMHIIYCDEVTVELSPNDGRSRVWRSKGERYMEKNFLPSYRFAQGRAMYWGAITWQGPRPLVLIQGAIKGEAYEQLLQEQISGLLERMNQRSAYLLQDHATSHEKGTKDVKIQLNIQTFDSYPSNSQI